MFPQFPSCFMGMYLVFIHCWALLIGFIFGLHFFFLYGSILGIYLRAVQHPLFGGFFF